MHKKLFIPGPVEVHPEILKACSVPMVGHRSKEYARLHAGVRGKLRKFFGIDKGSIFLFTSSATGAMEGAIRNLAAKRVLSCTCGAFSERWNAIARENGKEADTYGVEWGKPNLPEEIDKRLAGGKYDCLTLVHNETSTGLMNPLEAISGVMKKYPDVSFCVDSVSSMAGVPIDPVKLGIDYLLAGTQKAFGLPPGLAVVYVSDRAMEKAGNVPHRGHYFDLLQFKKQDEKDMTPETPVITLIHALGVQLDRFFAEGLENRYARHIDMAETCRSWAGARFRMFPEKGYESVTLSCIENTRTDIATRDLIAAAAERGIAIGNGYGKLKDRTFRIAHMGDHQPDELKQILGWLDEAIKAKGK